MSESAPNAQPTNASQQQARAQRELCVALSLLRTPEECRALLLDLCTPAELAGIAARWMAVDYIKQGLPHRSIHRMTGASLETIDRVAHLLAQGHGGYETASRRLEERRRAIAGASWRSLNRQLAAAEPALPHYAQARRG